VQIDDDLVLLAGGLVDEHETCRSWLLSLSSLLVVQEMDMPVARAYGDIVYLSASRQAVLGGAESAAATTETWDASTRRWLPSTPFREAVAGMRLVLVGRDQVLAVGGALSECDVEDGAFRLSAGVWRPEPRPAVPIGRNFTVTEVETGCLLFVSAGGTGDASTAQLYDAMNGAWTAVKAPREPRWGHLALPVGQGRVLVVGGLDCTSVELGTPERV
jgi:hypothetical protein